MKKFCLMITVAVFLLICLNGLQAQTTQTKPKEVEALKQFVGSWKCELVKDTTSYIDYKSFGTGIEGSIKYVSKGKTFIEEKLLWGFDKSGKGIGVVMTKGMDMRFYAFWWTSKSKYTYLPYSDISNPEKANVKYEGEIKSPDMFVESMIINDTPVRTTTCTRVK